MFSNNVKTQTITDQVYGVFTDYDSNIFADKPYPFPVLVWRWHHIWFCLLHLLALPRHWMFSSSWPSPEETGPHGFLGMLLHLQSPAQTNRFFAVKVVPKRCRSFRPDLPPGRGAPSLSCAHMEGALCGTRPGRWSKTSGHEASPLLPAGPATAVSALVKSFTHKNTRFRTSCFEYELRYCVAL